MPSNFDIQSIVKQITNTLHPELMLPSDTESPVAERMVRLVALLKELEDKLNAVDKDVKALRNNVLGLSDDLKKIEAVSDDDIKKAADKVADDVEAKATEDKKEDEPKAKTDDQAEDKADTKEAKEDKADKKDEEEKSS